MQFWQSLYNLCRLLLYQITDGYCYLIILFIFTTDEGIDSVQDKTTLNAWPYPNMPSLFPMVVPNVSTSRMVAYSLDPNHYCHWEYNEHVSYWHLDILSSVSHLVLCSCISQSRHIKFSHCDNSSSACDFIVFDLALANSVVETDFKG